MSKTDHHVLVATVLANAIDLEIGYALDAIVAAASAAKLCGAT
ncbi:hypothetical protein [Candidatus Methylacidithermus pantelleriae]|uniref:Uncharacterized protein n=1 Tax=Candidatus Methylacidithermus pantelleriae TaxID=2744239 RepID=A0A8J2FT72_9BACT|nr:hypothetical protein [Candidatus Methylacidithermus pantelleriae]CAF0703167.1 hypothetical protein MPNT_510010 [Candidatus Methylacidithermus pantelleriae]